MVEQDEFSPSGKQSLERASDQAENGRGGRTSLSERIRKISFSKKPEREAIDYDTYSAEFKVEFDPRQHKFDSVNFHLPHNASNLKQLLPQTVNQEHWQYTTVFLLAIIVGLLVGCVGWLMEAGVRWTTIGLYTVAQDVLIGKGFVIGGSFAFVGIAAVLAAGASSLVVFVSPLAAGSGIPEIKSYLNGVWLPGLLKFKTMVAKGVGVCLSIASGYVCGREGPMIHCGGILGAAVAMSANHILNSRVPFKAWDYFRTEAWKRDFTALGSAAGVAVAFQAPIGGLLFILEEAATHWSQTMTWATAVAAIIAAVLGSIFEEVSHGHLAVNFSEVGFVFGPLSNADFWLRDFGFYVIIGILGGLFGALLTALQKPLTLFRFKYINRPWRRLTEAVLINLLTNVVRLLIPALTNQCVPRDESFNAALEPKFSKDFSQFNCPDGEYNVYASLIYNPLDVVIQNLLHNENVTTWNAGVLLSTLVFFTFFVILTYGIAVPAGLFIPAYVWGAVMGRLIGLGAHAAFPEGRENFEISSYVFLGAVAGLAGATRMTVSVVLIACESSVFGTGLITGTLVAVIAKFTGDMFNKSIYDLHIDLKGIPILEPRILERPDLYYKVLCRDVMERKVAAIYDRSKVVDIIRLLRQYPYGSFPVVAKNVVDVDPDSTEPIAFEAPEPVGRMNFSKVQFKGMIERRIMIACLHHLVTSFRDVVLEGEQLPRNRYDIAFPNTRYKSREAAILDSVPSELYGEEIDVTPYIDRNPATISDRATVAEAREMFRSTGRRHIVCVWLKTGTIIGIITRKDILPEAIEFVQEQLEGMFKSGATDPDFSVRGGGRSQRSIPPNSATFETAELNGHA